MDRVIAFFDVDETLLTGKSMIDFLRFCRSADEHRAATEHLGTLARSGVDRDELNRAYYRLWAGWDWDELVAAGRDWYAAVRAGARIGPPFVASTRQALADHRESGHLIALLSGSFLPCVQPLADDLAADVVYCTHPELDHDGRITGQVRQPMIGRTKRVAVVAAAHRHGADPTQCHAYADHASDLAMLRAVGHPHVVGNDPVLRAAAHAAGWPVLDDTPLPLETSARRASS
ncbi:MAG: HAD family hydrolase [Sporichthyaceae bacterium]